MVYLTVKSNSPIMMRILSLMILMVSNISIAQYDYFQYFEGADTNINNSVMIHLDTSSENIWQVGRPQKTLFYQSKTVPNCLVTDTINYYPDNNTSSFYFGVDKSLYTDLYGVLAVQWQQKLDMDDTLDIGTIEYSLDTGATWTNVFNNPNNYNFYGYSQNNLDTLANGTVGFSGLDTNWADIWLCYDFSWLNLADSLTFKFTFKSDGVNNNREGWMIDNMYVHQTWIHTINEKEQEKYLIAYPNPTNGIVNIQAQKQKEFHIIETLTVTDINGRIVSSINNVPTKYYIDLREQPNGVYFINIQTNLKSETIKIVLNDQL
jgi:hypothetical protein